MLKLSSRFFPYLIAAVFFLFVAGSYALGWAPPVSAPPAGNVSAPLNVSGTPQSKTGGLILNTGLVPAPYGLIVDQGKVGIGTLIPDQMLEVVGKVMSSGTSQGFCIGTNCITSWPGAGGSAGKLQGASCAVTATYRDPDRYCTATATCPAGMTIHSAGTASASGLIDALGVYDEQAAAAFDLIASMNPNHSCVGNGSCSQEVRAGTPTSTKEGVGRALVLIHCVSPGSGGGGSGVIPAGLYGWCNSSKSWDPAQGWQSICAAAKAPAFCSPGTGVLLSVCACPSGYDIVETGFHVESNQNPARYEYRYSCYKN